MSASSRPSRRQFLRTAIATSTLVGFGGAIVPRRSSAQAQTPTTDAGNALSELLRPARLQPGDTVGIISPSGTTFLDENEDIVFDAMRGLGLVPKLAPHARDRYGYLAGRDRDRAADINDFFADPDVKALMPIRGGWGSARLLPELDYDLIRANPKIIVGFSDITALLLGIYAQTGLVTFHGPHGITSWKTDQTAAFRQVLFDGGIPTVQNTLAAGDADRLMRTENRIRTITPGRTQGELIGGNLSVISGMVGSPYFPDPTGKILFVEDIGEWIYRIDRMMTQLKLAGILDKLAGFIFGQCRNCDPGTDYGSLTMEEVLDDHIRPLGIPAWSGAMIGHVEPILTLPLGVPVEIDATAGTIEFLQAGVT